MSIEIVQHNWKDLVSPKALQVKADLIFADPPYDFGVKYDLPGFDDRLGKSKYRDFTISSILEMRERLRIGGTMWWMIPERHADMVGPLLEEYVGQRLYRIVFEESFAQYQDRTLTDDYRFIFCHQHTRNLDPSEMKSLLTFNPDSIREKSVRQEMGDKRANPAGRVPGRVWKMRRLQGTSKARVPWHPAQLAPELLTRIVRGWTKKGDLVLDGFAGSGNMGQVCVEEDRRCILVDASETYCKKMFDRLAIHASSGKNVSLNIGTDSRDRTTTEAAYVAP